MYNQDLKLLIPKIVNQILQFQLNRFNLNYSFGYILRNISNEELRNYHVSCNNNVIMSIARLISNRQELIQFLNILAKESFCDKINRPDTKWNTKLDRSLTFRHHLVALCKKLSSRVTLLRRLVGSGWGAGAKTLRIATLSLVYSTAEYCAPVWCRSAHTRLIDNVLNDALRIVTGCSSARRTRQVVQARSPYQTAASLPQMISNNSLLISFVLPPSFSLLRSLSLSLSLSYLNFVLA